MNVNLKGMERPTKDLHDSTFPQNDLKKVKVEDGTQYRRKMDDDYDDGNADSFSNSGNSDNMNYQSKFFPFHRCDIIFFQMVTMMILNLEVGLQQ
jgi:hypothetical protein